MATIDYNSGNDAGNVTFFSSNINFPVRFCVNNIGGIQIATGSALGKENTIEIGKATSFLEIYSKTTFTSDINVSNSVLKFEDNRISTKYATELDSRGLRTAMYETGKTNLRESWLTPTGFNISNPTKNILFNEYGINSSSLLLNVMGGHLNVSGDNILSDFSNGGFNGFFLTVYLNGSPFKIALNSV